MTVGYTHQMIGLIELHDLTQQALEHLGLSELSQMSHLSVLVRTQIFFIFTRLLAQ